jgi:hypothetical protein
LFSEEKKRVGDSKIAVLINAGGPIEETPSILP